ncbi:MAG: response regulator [Candidatus Latescibacteria bacterium]|nr:response regulator [Candidatus Latescibacterota bacterium]
MSADRAVSILVVDDEVLVAMGIRAMLAGMGYGDTFVASSGPEALAAIERRRPHLVFMDINLGEGQDGITTAGTIRERHRLPVVYVTADTDEATLMRAKATHPFGDLTKPIEERELRIAIELALDNHRLEQQLTESEHKYHQLFAEMGQGFALNEMLFDAHHVPVDYITMEVNSAFETILGASKEVVVGRPASQFLSRDELAGWLRFFGEVVLGRGSAHHEMYSPLNDKHFHAFAYAQEGARFAVLFEDITERKKAEERVRLDLVVQRLRNEVLQLRRREGWAGLTAVWHQEMRELLPCEWCGVALVDRKSRVCRIYQFSASESCARDHEAVPSRALAEAMRRQTPLYRGSLAEQEPWGDQENQGCQSLLEVPFAGGALLLGRLAAQAFSPGEIASVERLAAVFTEAQLRLGEQARREAVLQVREAVWQMTASDDLMKVLGTIREQLIANEMPVNDLGVSVVEGQAGAYTVRHYHHAFRGSAADPGWMNWAYPPVASEDGSPSLLLWKSGQTTYRRDLQAEDPFGETVYFPPQIRAVVDVPYSHGTLSVNSQIPDAFAEEDLQLLEELATVLSEGFMRTGDLKQLERRVRESEALSAAITALASTSEVEEILLEVVQEAAALVGAERATLFLFDESEGALVPRAQVGHEWQTYRQVRLLPGEDASGKAFATGQALLYDHAPDGAGRDLRPENLVLLQARRGGAVPLRLGGRVVGALAVASEVQSCTQHDLETLERLGQQAMLAIQRAQNLDELQGEIAERRQAEEELRRNQALLLGVAEGVPDAVFVKDLQGRYLLVNEGLCKITGKSREEVIGKDDNILFPPAEAAWLLEQDRRIMVSGLTQINEEELSVGGKPHFFLATKGPMRDARGQVIGLFGISRDITENRRLEQELIRIQRLRAAGELSAGVCHNLNNLLTGVLGPADLLQMTSTDPKIQLLSGMIVEAGTRAADLVHRLHLSVRGAATQATMPVALNEVIDGVVQMTRPRWKDEPEARGLAITLDTALSPVPPVRGTLSEVHDLLTNLLLNAVDALPEGGTITIRTASEGAFVRLDFADNGVGMDEQTRLRVFEPFFTTKQNVGSGLGLSTLYNSISHWGGRVAVESAPGQGTTFTLQLPVWQEEAREAPPPVRPGDSRPGRVLVVEDQPGVSGVLAEALSAKHQVQVFADGRQVLEQFRAGSYEVAIIDLGLPGLSGDQVARRIREQDPAIGMVLFTGWELEANDPRLAWFDLVLQKPLRSLAALAAVVAQAMELCDLRKPG